MEPTAAALAAAEQTLAEIARRIVDRQAGRTEIAARRAAGEKQIDDIGRVGLIDMDLADLGGMRTAATATLDAARVAHQAAVGELHAARRLLAGTQDLMTAEVPGEHADHLLRLLQQTIGDHAQLCDRMDVSNLGNLATSLTARLAAMEETLLAAI